MRRNVILLGLLIAVGLVICWPPSGTKGIRPTAVNKEGRAILNADLSTPQSQDGSSAGGASHLPDVKSAAARDKISKNYGKLPMSFEANRGQTDGRVNFLSRGPGYTLFLTGDQAVLALKKPAVAKPLLTAALVAAVKGSEPAGLEKGARVATIDSVLRMKLAGANPNAQITGADELSGRTNYLIGNDPKNWHTNVPTYAQVRYANVYPGVDLVYYGNQSGQLEYDFVVAPGADPAAIKLVVQAERLRAAAQHPTALRLAANGDLIVKAHGGDVSFHKPVVYQLGSGQTSATSPAQRTFVDAHYVLTASNGVRFALGAYDRSRPVFIDPILSYSTYLGGSINDAGQGIAVDAAGNAYVTGYTVSSGFPTLPSNQNFSSAGAATSSGLASGAQNAFVTKLNPSGTALVYSTYLGGSVFDSATGIALGLDGSGNPIADVAGYTASPDFPTFHAYQANLGGGTTPNSNALNAFVTVLNSAGNGLVYSTYLGGSQFDLAYAIAVDSHGNAYVTGSTSSRNFPTSPAGQNFSSTGAPNSTGLAGSHNAFVAKLTAAGGLAFSTYLGGTNVDGGRALALDSTGVYVAGFTSSTDFPVLNGFQSALGASGAQNAFVAKLNTNGTALVYSTYLGGEAIDNAYGIAVDNTGHAYVTGSTTSKLFPIPSGQAYNSFGFTQDGPILTNTGLVGIQNSFVSELSPDGSTLAYSTYLGGGGNESGNGIAVDSFGNICVVGNTTSDDFPVNPTLFELGIFRDAGIQPTFGGGAVTGDAFVAEISSISSGSALMFSTYLGGSGDDAASAVALTSTGDIYLTGATSSFSSTTPPTSPPGFPLTPQFTLSSPPAPNPNYPPFQANAGFASAGSGSNAFVSKVSAFPYAFLTPYSLSFPAIGIGTPSTDQVVTVTNQGNPPLIFHSINAIGGDSSDFVLDFNYPAPVGAPLCSPAVGQFINGNSLAAGASCTIAEIFTPTHVGAESSTLVVDDNAPPGHYTGVSGPVQNVNLSGTGLLAPTFTVASQSILYGTNSVTFSGTISAVGPSSHPGTFYPPLGDSISVNVGAGLMTGAGTITDATGDFSITVTGTATLGVAGSPYTVLYNFAGDTPNSFYSATNSATTLTVSPVPLTITASNGTMNYGGTPPTITPSYSGFVNGDTAASLTPGPACSAGATSASPVGSYNSICSGASDPNYTISYVNGMVSVAAVPLTVTASTGTMTYGGTPPIITASYSGLVNGDTAASLTPGPICSAGATSASPVGSYNSSCSGASDPNYIISYVNGTVLVTAAPLTVTASSGAMTYGGTVPTVTPIYGGFVNGQNSSVVTGTSCSTTATSTGPVGPYPTSCTGASAANYTISYVNGTVTVSTAALTVKASSASMAYGGTVPTITPSYSGFVNGDSSASLTPPPTCSTTATSSSAVGSYPSTCTGAVDPNYTISYVSGTVMVNAVTLTITGPSTSVVYGTAAALVSPTYSGFVNGQNATSLTTDPTCTTTDTSASPVGTYPVNCSGAVDANYSINYVAGTVTVTPAPLTITASSGSYTFGGTVPTITPSYSGFVNSQTAISLTTQPTCSTMATSASSVSGSPYPSSCMGAVDSNYSISYVNGQVKENPAALTITANNASMTAGSSLPAFTATYSGFVNGNTASNLNGTLVCTTTATSSSPAGTYPITCSGQSSTNYNITYVAGTLTITASTSQGTPIARVTPTCLNFTGLIEDDCRKWGGQPSAPQTVTLSNIGTGILNIASVQITGSEASDFSMVNNCGSHLAAGTQCTISVSFKPQTVGPVQASLVITDNSNNITGSQQTVSLNGVGLTELKSHFNEHWIKGGSYIWFTGSMRPQNINPNATTSFFMTHGTVTFTENNRNHAVNIPDCIVTFSPNVRTASTSFDNVNNRWVTVAPTWGINGNTFLSAVGYQIPPEGLPGSISNVAWTAAFSTDTPGASLVWQWAAAPYDTLPTLTDVNNHRSYDYNSYNVKPVDDNHSSQYKDHENAGTPEGWQNQCRAGATCDGVSDHTGKYCNPGGPICKPGPVYVPPCVTAPPTAVGHTSPPVPIKVRNMGSQPVHFTNVKCTGDFQVSNNISGTTLRPGESYTINVTFSPTQKGTRCGTLQLTDNATNSPQMVSLAGDGQ